MPRRFAASSISASSAASSGLGFGLPSSRKRAFFDRIAAFSKVPPIPTPAISGGQASGPAVLMHSRDPPLPPRQPPPPDPPPAPPPRAAGRARAAPARLHPREAPPPPRARRGARGQGGDPRVH